MEPTVQTDRTIPNAKPDITFRDNKNGTWMLIDVVVSGDKNVIQQEAENILKYENRTSDIERMWNVNVKVILVIIGATGTI
jgi:putative ribosome biogenesis GTPase RsgA